METNDLTGLIIECCIDIHKKMGPGLFESVYEEILHYELLKRDLYVQRQVDIPVFYDDLKMNIGFRADLIVESEVIVEIKSVENLNPVHFKQLTTYLKLSGCPVGLLINFNESLLKEGIRRVVNNFME
ncbi:MAG: GxxExxY protein [Chitinophagaceae bacterium]|nr:GxxExxY protein [Chitinophagaceae bacterium]